MTAQVPDTVIYQGEQHVVAAFSSGEPFVPSDAGYMPVAATTACWRGYVCGYEVRDASLLLDELWVNHQPQVAPISRRLQPPNLNGVVAQRDEKSYFGEWHFSRVDMPLSYTGGLLIGQGLIRGLYVHMGFHPAWKYESVYELEFESGQLTAACDKSAEMAKLRAQLVDELKPSGAADREQIKRWIAGCFSRDYSRPIDR